LNDILSILNLFNKTETKHQTEETNPIPPEILNQYPYGDFPIRYTRSGQENIRKNSESRFLNSTQIHKENHEQKEQSSNDFNLMSLLPLIQLLSNKQQPKDMFKILSKLLFKDNKDMENIFNLFSQNTKFQEIKKDSKFPDTQKVSINSLKRIN